MIQLLQFATKDSEKNKQTNKVAQNWAQNFEQKRPLNDKKI